MPSDFALKVLGTQKVRDALQAIAPQLRRGIVRKALRYAMQIVLDATARNPPTPMLKKPVYRRGVMIREPGTIIRNITMRGSKDARQEGNVGVFVNVKPAKGADRGAYNPKDPFYWRWVNFGSKHNKRSDFLTKGAAGLNNGAVLARIEEKLVPAIEKMNSSQRSLF